jgi:hypothetical protein
MMNKGRTLTLSTMTKYLAFLVLVVSLLFFTAQASKSNPDIHEGPHFSDVTVTNSETHLLLFGMLKNSFTDEMVQGLHSGLPVHFSIFIELEKIKDWIDESLVSLEIRHILVYDTLKEVYKVELEENNNKEYSFKTLQEAQKAVNEINGLKVVKLDTLVPDDSYHLRIRAELNKKTLPMGLHKVVPFISWWDMETDWHTINFRF